MAVTVRGWRETVGRWVGAIGARISGGEYAARFEEVCAKVAATARDQAIDASRREAESMVADAVVAAEAASAALTSDAIRVAQEHTEAASAAAMSEAIRVAREHTEAASAAVTLEAIRVAREHAEAAAAASAETAIASAKEHTEAAIKVAIDGVSAEASQLRREVTRIGALRLTAGVPVVSERHVEGPGAEPPLTDLVYAALEDRFRGSFAEIAERQARYVDYVASIADEAHPVLDLGSGRGEWLRVLVDRSVPVRGIDSNEVSVGDANAAGLPAEQGDLVDALHRAESGSIGAITMFQVVEHLPFAVLLDVFAESARVLRPGGVLIAETPNALNVRVASANFWLDPTHQRPLHPELLRFLAARAGFVTFEDVFANEIGVRPDLSDVPDSVRPLLAELANAFAGPGDYALIAWTAAST